MLDLPQSFLAPWAALLVVHSTVYRTFAQGARQVGAAVVGRGARLGGRQRARRRRRRRRRACCWSGWSLGSAAVVPGRGDDGGGDRADRPHDRLRRGRRRPAVTAGRHRHRDRGRAGRQRRGLAAAAAAYGDRGHGRPRRPGRRAARSDIADGPGRRAPRPRTSTAGSSATRDLDDDVDHAWALVRQATRERPANPRRSAGPLRDPDEWMDAAGPASSRRWPRSAACCAPCPGARRARRAGSRRSATGTSRSCAGGPAPSSEADPDPIRDCRARLDELVGAVDAEEATPRSGRSTAACSSTCATSSTPWTRSRPRTRCASRRCRSAGAEQLRTVRAQRSIARFTQVDATTMPTFS